MGHISLMIELERAYNIVVDDACMLTLTSVSAIRRHLQAPAGEQAEARKDTFASQVRRGLNGVVFERSAITMIDGQNGELLHRGYDVNDLATNATYEEVAYLLLKGELPGPVELLAFSNLLKSHRALPEAAGDLLQSLRHASPLVALRTTVSSLGTASGDPFLDAVQLIAQVPTVVTTHHALRRGRTPLPPRADLGHAANFLHMLDEGPHDPEEVRLFDGDLIVHADHDANASAFCGRVVTSTEADIYSAITAAIAAFGGPLHGGALEAATRMLDEIGTVNRVDAYIAYRLQNQLPVYGFGHRIYRTRDPQSVFLRAMAERLGAKRGDVEPFARLEAIVHAMRHYADRGMSVNVDFYACLAYRHLGIPDDLTVPTFVVSRVAGWGAQVLEQRSANILIRPKTVYVGAARRSFPVAERSVAGVAKERAC